MLVVTRSQKHKEEDKRRDPLYNMGDREENPFHRFRIGNSSNDEITDEMIQEAKQDPQFHIILDKILEQNKEGYFLLLENQGAKFPSDYNMEKIKEDPEKTEAPLNDLSTLTQQIRAL